MTFVIDASVTLSWFLGGEATDRTRALLMRLDGEDGLVPPVWPYEVSNGLLIAQRRGRATEAQVRRFAAEIRRLPVTVQETELHRILTDVLDLAREHRLSLYDATYVELASRSALPLATNDVDLRNAALALGVEVL